MAVNGSTYSEAIRAAGYSESVARAPTKLTKTKSFQDLLEASGVTDDRLTHVLEEGLAATKDDKPDFTTRHKYLETGLKLKGHNLKAENDSQSGNIYNTQVNINDNTPRGEKMVDSFKDYMLKQTLPKDPGGQQTGA